MAVSIQISDKHLRHRIDVLTHVDKVLMQLGEVAKGYITDNWLVGRGANDKQMPGLTTKYMRRKTSTGRLGIRNLNWSGKLIQSYFVKRLSKYSVLLRPQSPEEGKARGNAKYSRGRMMSVGRGLRDRVVGKFFGILKNTGVKV